MTRAFLTVLSLLLVASGAPGRSVQPPPTDGPRRVEATIAGPTESTGAAVQSLKEALARMEIELRAGNVARIDPAEVVGSADAEPGVVARLWIDLVRGDRAMLYLTDAQRRRVYVRVLPAEHGFDPVVLDLLGLVAQSSIEALLAGQPIGVAREEYERTLRRRPSSPPTAAHPRRTQAARQTGSTPKWQLLGSYQASLLGSSVIQHGAGVGLAASLESLALATSCATSWPVEVDNDGLGVRLLSLTVQANAGYSLLLGREVSMIPGLGMGLELTRVDPRLTVPGAKPEPAFWASAPVARGFVAFDYQLGNWSVALATAVERDLLGIRYTVRRGGVPETVFTPARWRPVAALTAGTAL